MHNFFKESTIWKQCSTLECWLACSSHTLLSILTISAELETLHDPLNTVSDLKLNIAATLLSNFVWEWDLVTTVLYKTHHLHWFYENAGKLRNPHTNVSLYVTR